MLTPGLRQEIDSLFQVAREKCTPDEVVIRCPECADSSGHRSINVKSLRTFCWKCGKGKNNKGHFIGWARALGYSISNSDDSSTIPIEELLYKDDDNNSTIVPVVQAVSLPAGFTPIGRTPRSIYTKLICEMARRKNLYYDDYVEAGVGYTMDDPTWEAYAIFPVTDYDTCVYYQGRTYIDVPGETTKRFPSKDKVKYGAGYWVYNIDEVRLKKPEIVVVVESILNVLSLRYKFKELGWNSIVPVCVFKHHISKVQAIKLLRCRGVQEYCLLFDHDAIDTTWNAVEQISNKATVTIAEMPMLNGNTKLDPNDDVEAAVKAIERRTLYTTANAVGHLLGTKSKYAKGQLDIASLNFCSS